MTGDRNFQAEADTEIELASFDQLTDDEREALIADIRERRLSAFIVYEELQEERKQAKNEKIRQQIVHMCKMFEKDLGRADKAIAKVEDRVRKIRIMRMEIGE